LAGALACAASLLVLWVAPRAEAAWSAPLTITQQHGVGGPLVAMDSFGNTVFAWAQVQDGSVQGATYTRSRLADGTLTPIQRVTPPGETGSLQDLAVDPAGNAYFVWQVFDPSGYQIRARVRAADGTLRPVQTLANGNFDNGVGDASVGVGDNGRAVFSWLRANGDNPNLIQARSRSASGQLGPVRTVARGSLPRMAVDASGNATFAWRVHVDSGNGTPNTIWTRVLTSAGTLTEPARVSRVGHGAGDPRVGVSRQGRAVFEWDESDPDGSHPVLLVRGRAPDGSLRPPQLLAKTNSDNVDMAVSPNGAAVACWIDGNFDLRERGRTVGGTLGPLRTVAARASNPGLCRPGIDSHGTVALAWTGSDGSKQRVYARSGPVDGALGPVQTLSPAGFNARVSDLTVGADGTAPVGWTLGRNGFALQAAFGP